MRTSLRLVRSTRVTIADLFCVPMIMSPSVRLRLPGA
jgi:hypothetical protein